MVRPRDRPDLAHQRVHERLRVHHPARGVVGQPLRNGTKQAHAVVLVGT
ncbi:hypothetical protein WME94_06180 [Sorangium sp. So ce429]